MVRSVPWHNMIKIRLLVPYPIFMSGYNFYVCLYVFDTRFLCINTTHFHDVSAKAHYLIKVFFVSQHQSLWHLNLNYFTLSFCNNFCV
jgi:hypothetical protein